MIARLHVIAMGEDREIGIELNVVLRKGTKIKVFLIGEPPTLLANEEIIDP